MRRISLLLGAAATAVVASLATAPASSAGAADTCVSGEFCLYSGTNQTGTLLWSGAGNLDHKVSGARSYKNLGTEYPGADHIYIDWYHYIDGTKFTHNNTCVHYPPDTYKGNFHDYAYVTAATWGGECP
ncbi:MULTISPECIES: peptidase inhibitor family I36 protein [unclassified Streptomyces]|uniref:peptidase inhibitor family I36 protein n=1 Tax=unclassified Streptomyces TaxID=2593676 RepID=UPI00093C978E|nr:peptidase inhibitor family I36 protein [Streptomyces sp. CB02400]OKK07420.1 hypothetical protein AMK33_19570 [Streptomyces sp. CB02400]